MQKSSPMLVFFTAVRLTFCKRCNCFTNFCYNQDSVRVVCKLVLRISSVNNNEMAERLKSWPSFSKQLLAKLFFILPCWSSMNKWSPRHTLLPGLLMLICIAKWSRNWANVGGLVVLEEFAEYIEQNKMATKTMCLEVPDERHVF